MLNEKQENFSQAYVLHRNATEAAKAAGYSDKSAANQGYRLLQNNEILERIEDLANELETNINVIEEIESQYTYAKANGHTNSAIKALELLSRIKGTPSDDALKINQESLETEIARNIDILGEEQFFKILGRSSLFKEFFEEEPPVEEEDDEQTESS